MHRTPARLLCLTLAAGLAGCRAGLPIEAPPPAPGVATPLVEGVAVLALTGQPSPDGHGDLGVAGLYGGLRGFGEPSIDDAGRVVVLAEVAGAEPPRWGDTAVLVLDANAGDAPEAVARAVLPLWAAPASGGGVTVLASAATGGEDAAGIDRLWRSGPGGGLRGIGKGGGAGGVQAVAASPGSRDASAAGSGASRGGRVSLRIGGVGGDAGRVFEHRLGPPWPLPGARRVEAIAVNDAGDAAALFGFTGGRDRPGGGRVHLVALPAGGGSRTLAEAGDAGAWGSLGPPAIDGDGEVWFLGWSNGLRAGKPRGLLQLLWAAPGEDAEAAARVGDPAPGGGAFEALSDPRADAGGGAVFTARVTPTPDPQSRDDPPHDGVFRVSAAGEVSLVAGVGTPAPGGPGVSGRFAWFGDVAAGPGGLVLFHAGVVEPADPDPGGVTPVPTPILVVAEPDGTLRRVAAVGDPLAGGVVASLAADRSPGPHADRLGPHRPLNRRGQVAFRFELADGRVGVAVSRHGLGVVSAVAGAPGGETAPGVRVLARAGDLAPTGRLTRIGEEAAALGEGRFLFAANLLDGPTWSPVYALDALLSVEPDGAPAPVLRAGQPVAGTDLRVASASVLDVLHPIGDRPTAVVRVAEPGTPVERLALLRLSLGGIAPRLLADGTADPGTPEAPAGRLERGDAASSGGFVAVVAPTAADLAFNPTRRSVLLHGSGAPGGWSALSPGTLPGGEAFHGGDAVAVGPDGTTAFTASVGEPPLIRHRVLVAKAPGGPAREVAREGDAAPGGGRFGPFSGLGVGGAGGVFFGASIKPDADAPGEPWPLGLFRSRPGGTEAVIREGDRVPGGVVERFSQTLPAGNGFVFQAKLAADPADPRGWASDDGIFRLAPSGRVEVLVREGDRPAGVPGVLGTPVGFAVNAPGGVALLATTRPDRAEGTTHLPGEHTTLWVVTPGGLARVAACGEPFLGGTLRRLGLWAFGLDDGGTLGFFYELTDGRSGVAAWSPEP